MSRPRSHGTYVLPSLFLPLLTSSQVSLEFSARNGIITEVSIKTGETDASWGPISSKSLVGRKVHEITDWELILIKNLPQQSRTMSTRILGRRLNDMFGGGSIDLSQGRVASERVLSIRDKRSVNDVFDR